MTEPTKSELAALVESAHGDNARIVAGAAAKHPEIFATANGIINDAMRPKGAAETMTPFNAIEALEGEVKRVTAERDREATRLGKRVDQWARRAVGAIVIAVCGWAVAGWLVWWRL